MLRTIDAPVFGQAIDPADVLNFGIDIGALLDTGIIDISSIALRVDDAAANLGVGISVEEGRTPTLANDGRTVVFWFVIDPARQNDPAFDRFGVEVEVTADFATTHYPPQRFERSAVAVVRNR